MLAAAPARARGPRAAGRAAPPRPRAPPRRARGRAAAGGGGGGGGGDDAAARAARLASGALGRARELADRAQDLAARKAREYELERKYQQWAKVVRERATELDKQYKLGQKSTALKNEARAAYPRVKAAVTEFAETPAGRVAGVAVGVWFIASGAFFFVLNLAFVSLWLAPFWAPLLLRNVDTSGMAEAAQQAQAQAQAQARGQSRAAGMGGMGGFQQQQQAQQEQTRQRGQGGQGQQPPPPRRDEGPFVDADFTVIGDDEQPKK